MRNGMRTWTFGAALALVALGLVMGSAAQAVSAQETNPSVSRTITVSGSGDAYGTPDIASISMGVDISDTNLNTALNSANSTLAAIVEALKTAGIEDKDLQTAYFNVYPEDQYDATTGNRSGEIKFHVQSSVNVTVRDISRVAAVIEAGLNAGANSVSSLSFGIADVKSLEEQARLNAVADARDRAEQLAAAFGVSLGQVISVSESYSSGPVQPLVRADMAMAMSAPPQISTGQLSVGVQVSVTFAIGS